MSRIRQILRCFRAGNSSRTISSVLEISRNTIMKYIDKVNESGKTVDEVLAMEDHELYQFFNVDPRVDAECSSDRYKELKEEIPEYAKMLRKKNMTRKMAKRMMALPRSEETTMISAKMMKNRPAICTTEGKALISLCSFR